MQERKVTTQPNLEGLLPKDYAPTVAIVGSGSIGVELVNQLIDKGWSGHIKLFGQAQHRPYRRELLPSYIQGDVNKRDIKIALHRHPYLVQHKGCQITGIDLKQKQIQDANGHWHYYDKLVLATGASICLPQIHGIELQGVHGFRSVKDAPVLMQQCIGSQHTVVVGNGAIALETARAMQGFAKQVTLVPSASRLLPFSLDHTAARLLQLRASQLGIRFRLGRKISEIYGVEKVSGLRLEGGEAFDCDRIIFTEPNKANIHIAEQANIACHDAICIDEQMQTSAKDVFAIGECSEIQGITVSRRGTALAQAEYLASALCGDTDARFVCPPLSNQTRVLGIDVCSLGNIAELKDANNTWVYQTHDGLRKVWLKRGQVIGALGVGGWSEFNALQDAMQNGRQLWPWQKSRFIKTGNLALDKAAGQPSSAMF